jgi:hypothetical protein
MRHRDVKTESRKSIRDGAIFTISVGDEQMEITLGEADDVLRQLGYLVERKKEEREGAAAKKAVENIVKGELQGGLQLKEKLPADLEEMRQWTDHNESWLPEHLLFTVVEQSNDGCTVLFLSRWDFFLKDASECINNETYHNLLDALPKGVSTDEAVAGRVYFMESDVRQKLLDHGLEEKPEIAELFQ